MPRRKTLPTALTTAAAVTALMLAGCSSSPTGEGANGSGSNEGKPSQAQSATVYDFPRNGMEPVGKGEQLTVVLPDDLKQAAGKEASSVVVESFTVASHSLQTSEYCAVDISVEFVSDDAKKGLLNSYNKVENLSDGTDGQKIAHATLYRGEIATLDELDETNPEEGIYAADDGSHIVQVADCASSPQDDDADITLGFSYPGNRNSLGDSYEVYKDFVKANLAVMTDGSVSVASTDTGDWTRDSSGKWIKD
ncbi:hypothetical protein CGZ98_16530 [Enemella evansiae]|uniref:hypothetical protein n=1 Tax=Enemella evansiae TaxID=2016499 RepID=UPI000B97A213|nr:hypothetical protein [Enemella evansiae]OYO08157.1 hypothetical protein CGZ98_16530 [Enemella evansiae]